MKQLKLIFCWLNMYDKHFRHKNMRKNVENVLYILLEYFLYGDEAAK
jgi:hypothetical protein